VLSCGSAPTAATPTAPPPAVVFSVTGSAKAAQISFSNADESISILSLQVLPFTHTWSVLPAQFQGVLLTAQINTVGDTGTVRVSVSENGVEIDCKTAAAFRTQRKSITAIAGPKSFGFQRVRLARDFPLNDSIGIRSHSECVTVVVPLGAHVTSD
jgi:hypothetical protein